MVSYGDTSVKYYGAAPVIPNEATVDAWGWGLEARQAKRFLPCSLSLGRYCVYGIPGRRT